MKLGLGLVWGWLRCFSLSAYRVLLGVKDVRCKVYHAGLSTEAQSSGLQVVRNVVCGETSSGEPIDRLYIEDS